MPYLPYAERVVDFYSKTSSHLKPLKPQEALETFHRLSGAYKDTDEWYEERCRLFLDYLVFDVPSPPYRNIMHRYFVESIDRIRREDLVDTYRGFLSSHPSLFDILKIGRDDVVMKDLIGGGCFKVTLPEAAYSFVEGVIINARIISSREKLILARGILLHPDQASPHIYKLVEELKKERLLTWKSFFLFARMKLQHDMSPSFKLASIYSPRSFLIKREV